MNSNHCWDFFPRFFKMYLVICFLRITWCFHACWWSWWAFAHWAACTLNRCLPFVFRTRSFPRCSLKFGMSLNDCSPNITLLGILNLETDLTLGMVWNLSHLVMDYFQHCAVVGLFVGASQCLFAHRLWHFFSPLNLFFLFVDVGMTLPTWNASSWVWIILLIQRVKSWVQFYSFPARMLLPYSCCCFM